jgi:hypothetical protein
MNLSSNLIQFRQWIDNGNAILCDGGYWLEQSTMYNKKFTYIELWEFFKKEFC